MALPSEDVAETEMSAHTGEKLGIAFNKPGFGERSDILFEMMTGIIYRFSLSLWEADFLGDISQMLARLS